MKTVEVEKLWTQAEYARKIGKSRVWVNKLIQSKELKSVKIKGTTLVVA
jgi:hypothetical protein